MGFGLKECIRSRVGVLEAAISGFPPRTTALSVMDSASCCRLGILDELVSSSCVSLRRCCGGGRCRSCRSRVFQGLRVPFSPAAHGKCFGHFTHSSLRTFTAPLTSGLISGFDLLSL